MKERIKNTFTNPFVLLFLFLDVMLIFDFVRNCTSYSLMEFIKSIALIFLLAWAVVMIPKPNKNLDAKTGKIKLPVSFF